MTKPPSIPRELRPLLNKIHKELDELNDRSCPEFAGPLSKKEKLILSYTILSSCPTKEELELHLEDLKYKNKFKITYHITNEDRERLKRHLLNQ